MEVYGTLYEGNPLVQYVLFEIKENRKEKLTKRR